jgi:hypothetical protein
MQVRRISTVQQTADEALFCRGKRWVDGRILAMKDSENLKPDETIKFGSPEHFALACRLADEGAGRNSLLAMNGEVLLMVDGKRVLITAPDGTDETPQTP